jgi:hypothetical protein
MLEFEVGSGLGRIRVILQSFLFILPPILPQILPQSYQNVVEITGLSIILLIHFGVSDVSPLKLYLTIVLLVCPS